MPPFIPLPRFMLAGEYSINAKPLYGLLLNRTTLSQKSGWVSEDGNVYVIYTIKQMANDLDRSERTVKTALRELENAGLITRIRQGWNQANRIFLQIPDRVQVSSRPEGNICPMDVQDSSPCMGQKLPASNTDTEYKEHSKTERVESTRRRYGEFQNVFLSGEECSRLETAYPGKAAEYIERLSQYMVDRDRLDEIVDLILETVCTRRKTIRVAGDDYPAELVKSKFMKLDSEHIRFVLDCMRENTTKIRNIKQYLKAALFNAPSTIGNYYRLIKAHFYKNLKGEKSYE